MEIFYVFNIILATALLFWPVWFSRAVLRLELVNPFTITLILSLPVQVMKLFGGPLVLIEEGLFDLGYQFAILMTNVQIGVQMLSMFLFYNLFRSFRIERHLPMRLIFLRPIVLRRGAALFLVLFFASFFLLASAEYGVINWILNPREGYQLYRTGQGHWYALAVSALSVSYLLSFLGKPRPIALLRSTFVHIACAYLLGSKGIMLAIFGSALVFLWFLRWRHLGKFLMLGMPPVFCLLLLNLYLALADGFNLQAVLEYFDYYMNAANYYREYFSGEIDLFYGDVFLGGVWSYVPRALWPEKPVVYGILLINEIFYPGQAELTNTPAFGGAVEQFADFGVVGVIFFGFFSAQAVFTALLSYFIFRRPGFDIERVSLASVLFLTVQYAPAFGTFFPGGLYLLLLLVVVGLLFLVWLMYPRRRLSDPSNISNDFHVEGLNL